MRGEINGGIQLDGIQVYDRAVRMMSDTVNRLQDNDIEPTIIIGHQANSRILQKVREKVGARDAVFVDCVEQFGNTSSASIPLALGACVAERSIPLAGRSTLVAYGAGEAWGGVAVDYDLRVFAQRQQRLVAKGDFQPPLRSRADFIIHVHRRANDGDGAANSGLVFHSRDRAHGLRGDGGAR